MNSSIGARLVTTAIATVGLVLVTTAVATVSSVTAQASVSATHIAATANHVVMNSDNNPWP
jgi:hypothetical protein